MSILQKSLLYIFAKSQVSSEKYSFKIIDIYEIRIKYKKAKLTRLSICNRDLFKKIK